MHILNKSKPIPSNGLYFYHNYKKYMNHSSPEIQLMRCIGCFKCHCIVYRSQFIMKVRQAVKQKNKKNPRAKVVRVFQNMPQTKKPIKNSKESCVKAKDFKLVSLKANTKTIQEEKNYPKSLLIASKLIRNRGRQEILGINWDLFLEISSLFQQLLMSFNKYQWTCCE